MGNIAFENSLPDYEESSSINNNNLSIENNKPQNILERYSVSKNAIVKGNVEITMKKDRNKNEAYQAFDNELETYMKGSDDQNIQNDNINNNNNDNINNNNNNKLDRIEMKSLKPKTNVISITSSNPNDSNTNNPTKSTLHIKSFEEIMAEKKAAVRKESNDDTSSSLSPKSKKEFHVKTFEEIMTEKKKNEINKIDNKATNKSTTKSKIHVKSFEEIMAEKRSAEKKRKFAETGVNNNNNNNNNNKNNDKNNFNINETSNNGDNDLSQDSIKKDSHRKMKMTTDQQVKNNITKVTSTKIQQQQQQQMTFKSPSGPSLKKVKKPIDIKIESFEEIMARKRANKQSSVSEDKNVQVTQENTTIIPVVVPTEKRKVTTTSSYTFDSDDEDAKLLAEVSAFRNSNIYDNKGDNDDDEDAKLLAEIAAFTK